MGDLFVSPNFGICDTSLFQINKLFFLNQKPSFTRRRTRSLTIFNENKDDKVNIGVEWFVPKLKRQQRSSSLHGQCQSSSPIDSQNRDLESNGIRMRKIFISQIQFYLFFFYSQVLTTIDNDESSSSTSNSNIRRTHTQPAISWLPLTREQVCIILFNNLCLFLLLCFRNRLRKKNVDRPNQN